ncbi:MAG: HEAT repeat domain-containing protein [Deltaproteobacteria bacterium]|nr:MAG: HEAT repeat domain-containing protein [Deltaproteobacteria bacterium]
MSDVLHAVRVPYACACGATFPVRRIVAIGASSPEEAAAWAQSEGTVEGTCPACAAPAFAVGPLYVATEDRLYRIVSRDHACTPEDPGELRAVLEAAGATDDWIIETRTARLENFVAVPEANAEPRAGGVRRASARRPDGEPTRVRAAPSPADDLTDSLAEEGETVRANVSSPSIETVVVDSGPVEVDSSASLRAEIVARAGDGLGAHVGDLRELDGRVRVVVRGASADKWSKAELSAYPVHLRSYGYPLYGLRVVGRAAGQVGCIDAVVDPGEPVATDIARVLSQGVRFQLVVLGGGEFRRELEAPGFERNAVTCLESAQARLATEGLPPSRFPRAVEELARHDAAARLDAAALPHPLRIDAPIETPRQAYEALERLDRAARPEHAAKVLEEAGVAYADYDAWRRRVLEAATDFGIAAPRRFWRRITAAGIAEDLGQYVERLAWARARHIEDGTCDLDDRQRIEAWQRIWDLCERKAIEPPPELRAALGVSVDDAAADAPSGDTTAGIIARREDTHARWRRRLLDPTERLSAITEALSGSSIDDRTLSEILEQLDALAPDELLAVLPELPRLGKRVVPGLVARLGSTRREVRQGAAIALGAIGGTEAIAALVDYLLREPTRAWIDAARALGAHGSEALDVLAQRIRRTKARKDIERLVRALAEIAVADAEVCERLERLARDAERSEVARIAQAALAQRSTVREEGRRIRGEAPLSEVTVVRGFSRRVHEALFVPELDLDEALSLDS